MGSARAKLFLAIVLVLALAVRLRGLWFGLPFVYARPDELLIIGTALGFFTKTLHPGFFDYPGLYLYLVGGVLALYYAYGRAIGWFTSRAQFVAGPHDHWQAFYILGRGISVVCGTLTTLRVYRLGVELFDEAVGLIAAFFLSLAFLHVRDSHYATTDITMTFFVTCAVLALARLHRDRRRAHAWTAAVFAGLAMGTKYNGVLLAVPMVVVEALHAWPRRGDWRATVRRSYLPLMAAIMLVTFVMTSPYVVVDYPKAIHDLRSLQHSMRAGMTPPGMLSPGWIYHFVFSLRYGLGLPLLAASMLGLVLMAWRQPAAALILGSFPATYYVVAGTSANVFVRYMIPVVPFLCVFAAFLVRAAADAIAARTPIPRSVAAASLAIALIAPSAWSVAQFDTILAREDSRMIAANWVQEHVPRGATIFEAGNSYGHPPLEDRANPKYRLLGYDYRADNFIEGNRPFEGEPDWIIVQRSGIPYSHLPPSVATMLDARYTLVQVIRATDLDEPGNVYDMQDGFYVPYGGFRGVRRPGPNLEIYQRKAAS